ncbi:MAG: hypothetical protein HY674_06605 [Chloroflexi bacterium]|nr:hypothetical protein [Chloroflexota bacterium]
MTKLTRLLQSAWAVALLGALVFLATLSMLWPSNLGATGQAGATGAAVAEQSVWHFENAEIDQLIDALKKEKASLTTREQQLNELALRLQSERGELDKVVQSVRRMQQDFDKDVVRVQEEELTNLKKLAKVYAAMDPDGAAAILKELDDVAVVKILLYMKENETAPILEVLAKEGEAAAKRAAAISERLRLSISKPPVPKSKS